VLATPLAVGDVPANELHVLGAAPRGADRRGSDERPLLGHDERGAVVAGVCPPDGPVELVPQRRFGGRSRPLVGSVAAPLEAVQFVHLGFLGKFELELADGVRDRDPRLDVDDTLSFRLRDPVLQFDLLPGRGDRSGGGDPR